MKPFTVEMKKKTTACEGGLKDNKKEAPTSVTLTDIMENR